MTELAGVTSGLPKTDAGAPGTARAAEGTSLTAFLRAIDSTERRTFWACALGYALDGLDYMIFPLVMGTVIAYWQVDRGTAGLAVTATLLCSAVGGWMAGYISDRFGRVRALQLTILWFATFSLFSAFAQSFQQLAVFRALLGFGFGGEWTAGAVLMGETIRPQFRGRAVGGVQSGWAVGWGTAVLIQAILFSVLPAQTAWRWMFAIGFAPALFVFFVQRVVPEPQLAIAARAARSRESGGSQGSGRSGNLLLDIFSRDIIKITALAALLSIGAQGGYYAVNTWLPLFLQNERGLSIVGSTSYLAFLIVGAFSGYLVGAWLTDRIGRRNLFLIFSVAAVVVVLVFTRLPVSNRALWLLGFPLGFFSSGYFAGTGAFLSELFPTRVRGSAMGFTYNFGRGLGALFPTLIGYVSKTMALSLAIAIFASIAYACMFVAALLLPETRGKQL